MTQDLPRLGPCAQWITGQQVQAENYPPNIAVDAGTAAEMAQVASELLYNFSGQQFTGVCGPVTVRPISRPIDADTRGLVSRLPAGYIAVWGWSSAWGQPASGAASHYGTSTPPEVNLGAYPVIEVLEVKLDGVVIPPTEYYVQDRRNLVRIRPTAAAEPTERYGWPTTQIMDLPDTEPGTFSVTYTYGTPQPQSGTTAALALAKELTIARLGGNSAIPRRITTISRTGESISVDDTRNILQKIPEVQVFLAAFNPSGLIRQPIVWSPDAGRPRRNPANLT